MDQFVVKRQEGLMWYCDFILYKEISEIETI